MQNNRLRPELDPSALARELSGKLLIGGALVPAHRGDLNGVYAAVVLRALLPACSILLCPGGSGIWVDEPLARAKARGYEFGLLAEPIHPEKLFELVTELIGGDVEPIRKLSVPGGG